MEIIKLARGSLEGDGFGSRGVQMSQLVKLTAVGELRVHVAGCEPGGVLGRHEAGMHQLFAVVSGSGWVVDATGVRVAITEGQAAMWMPGEMHESGSDIGMAVVIVASAQPFRPPAEK